MVTIPFVGHLAAQFLFTDSQQEFCLFFYFSVDLFNLLGQQMVFFQYVLCLIHQGNGFLPEVHVGFHIAPDDGIGGTTASTLGSKWLFGI